jgi:hypothetical protein
VSVPAVTVTLPLTVQLAFPALALHAVAPAGAAARPKPTAPPTTEIAETANRDANRFAPREELPTPRILDTSRVKPHIK